MAERGRLKKLTSDYLYYYYHLCLKWKWVSWFLSNLLLPSIPKENI